jgi:hypothetical protein
MTAAMARRQLRRIEGIAARPKQLERRTREMHHVETLVAVRRLAAPLAPIAGSH